MLPILEGTVEQQLHTETDAEERLPRRCLRLHEIEEPTVAQLLHGVTESSDPRQNHMIRLPDDVLICRHHHLLADRPERALKRKEISHAVIDYCNHSRPFNLNVITSISCFFAKNLQDLGEILPQSLSSLLKRISTARAWAVSPSLFANMEILS